MKTKRFSSMGTIAFDIEHDGEEPTAKEITDALQGRLFQLDGALNPHHVVEVTDTYEMIPRSRLVKVLVTRDTTESAWVTVDAGDLDLTSERDVAIVANRAAQEARFRAVEWTPDDYAGAPYWCEDPGVVVPVEGGE